jgi:hypothetical protein
MRCAATWTDARLGVEAEMAAARGDSMWRCAENFDERHERRGASALDDTDANALAGDGEWNA